MPWRSTKEIIVRWAGFSNFSKKDLLCSSQTQSNSFKLLKHKNTNSTARLMGSLLHRIGFFFYTILRLNSIEPYVDHTDIFEIFGNNNGDNKWNVNSLYQFFFVVFLIQRVHNILIFVLPEICQKELPSTKLKSTTSSPPQHPLGFFLPGIIIMYLENSRDST